MRTGLFDDNGKIVKHGDVIEFSYGIPSRRVVAPVERRGKHLFALTAGHHPIEVRLDQLRGMVGSWYRRGKGVG